MPVLNEPRRRSVGFLEREGDTWACFLVTFQADDGQWRGYFSFRPEDGEAEEDEIRTADIFREESEGEIDRKARDLGRPLLSGLLASALHTRDQREGSTPKLRRWFRRLLAENSRELAGEWGPGGANGGGTDLESLEEVELSELRSLYSSYRLDQVAHLIALVRPRHFQETVETILDGKSFDFGAKDQLQFAMMVVERLEELLPLPPFEVWAEDYLGHRDEYALYAHTLHREGRLP